MTPVYEPAPPKPGPKWILLGAVAAVLALAVFFAWPYVFPAGVPGASETPGPTVPATTSPTNSSSATSSPTHSASTTPTRTTASLPPVTPKSPLRAPRLNNRFVIDGQTTDWQWQHEARTEFRVAGTSTATGSIYLMWDDEALYLLAQVTDSSFAPPDPRQPSQTWRGDSVIFELGPDKRQLGPGDLARKTDAYYVFGVTQGPTPLVSILRPSAKRTSFDILDQSRTTITAAIARTNDGYDLEARIPWRASNLNGPRAGAVFAANVEVSERKAGNSDNLGMMGTNPQRQLVNVRAHPAYWHDLELLG